MSKGWKFRERLTAQFRAEFFNVLNHPNFANPYGASNGFGIGAKEILPLPLISAVVVPHLTRQVATRCSDREGTARRNSD